MQRLKNRQAYLESGSRKQRTHRLITRGAAIESIAPQTKAVSYTHLMCIRDSRGTGHEWDRVCSGEKGNRRVRGLPGGFDRFP